MTALARAQARLTVLQATKPWRAWSRYGRARGNVLAGGIAYVAFFAVFPALAVGFTVLGLVVGDSPDLQVRVAEQINTIVGATLIGTPSKTGVVGVDTLVQGNLLTVTGLSGLVLLLLSGLGWIDALRQGVRAVFDLPDEGNPVLNKLRDVLSLALVGAGVLVSFGSIVLLSAASSYVLDWLGVVPSTPVRLVVSVLVDLTLLGLDAALFLFVVRVLSRIRVPVGEIGGAAVIFAVGFFALKVGGGLLLNMASRNRFLAAFSLVVGLLIWFNAASRLVLVATAWAATTVDDLAAGQRAAGEAAAAHPAPAASQGTALTAPGVRAADRVAVVAGVMIGAGGAAVLGSLRRAVSGVVHGSGDRER